MVFRRSGAWADSAYSRAAPMNRDGAGKSGGKAGQTIPNKRKIDVLENRLCLSRLENRSVVCLECV